LQPKLQLSQSTDPLEREADRMADQVMRMPGNDKASANRKEACNCGSSTKLATPCPKCAGRASGKETLYAKVQTNAAPLDHWQAAIQSVVSGAGRPLDGRTRTYFEERFARDFSDVRIHTNEQAASSASQVAARAYTVGRHIVFGKGQFAPATSEGQRLIAHELTHVVQQGQAGQAVDRSSVDVEQHSAGIEPMVQRDLAIEPPRPAAVGRVLTTAEMTEAISFNDRVLGAIANSADIIQMIRDVIGISRTPAVVDEDFVNGVVRWQANFGLSQDGKLGPATARPLFREIGAEGVGRGEVSVSPTYAPAGPINVPRATPRIAPFTMSAEFRSDPTNGVFPSCCEVRQEIQWDAAFVAASVAAGTGAVPHAGFPAAHPAGTWIEDRDEADGRYGWRTGPHSDPGPGDQYIDTTGAQNQAFGHRWVGRDTPEAFATDRGSWSFRLGVYDMCNGNQLLEYSPTLVVNWL
jgi:hypothetical protein